MDKRKISMAVIRRLPKYYRHLNELIQSEVNSISSSELSKELGFTASQIRNDFNNFGYFGRQGYGYNVKELHSQIGGILGLVKKYNTIIIGAGNVGQAIANYTNFHGMGFNLVGLFDVNPKIIGLTVRDVEVIDIDYLDTFIAENSIDIAILCTPKSAAQNICDIIVKSGVKGIWNFTQVDLQTPRGVIVENVDLSDSLLTLSCLM